MFNKGYLYSRTILPTIILLVLLFFVPFCILLMLSLTNYNLVGVPGTEKFIGFNNYLILIQDKEFLNSILVTAYYSILCISQQLIIGLIICEALSSISHLHAKRFLIIYLIPVFIPYVTVGLIWKLILNGEFGLLSYYLDKLLPFINAKSLLSDKSVVVLVLSVIDTWQWAPFAGLLFYVIKNMINHNIYEAASIDGAARLKIFTSITLPLLIPAILTFTVIRFIESFKDFDKIYILTGGGPGNSTEIISLFIWRKAFKFYEFGYSSAISVISYIIIFGCSYAIFKYLTRHEN